MFLREVRPPFLIQQLYLLVKDGEQLHLLRICLKQYSYLVDIFFAPLRIVPSSALKVNSCHDICITGRTIYLDRRESPDGLSGSVYAMLARERAVSSAAISL
jgi:hypothetical protein